MEIHIDLPEQNILSDMDLCIILGNTIENAINTCTGILNANDRFLKNICKNNNIKLFIQIMNSFKVNVTKY
ncbi:MAG: GHKL domain-containing protein [Eubacteriales bacterium]